NSTSKSTKNEHKIFSQLFGKLSIEERAVLCLIDYLGVSPEASSKILSKKTDEIQALLAGSRKVLVAAKF
ncbi:hypothetical protein N9W79_02425, partial [bacterium]|nr:hypothetical protein [bacterium]